MEPPDDAPLRFLIGPTATGKSEVGARVAERLGWEVLSLDSMLVYRGLDVGTAKPGPEVTARAPHRLIDLVEPTERYDASRYLADAEAALAAARAAGSEGLFTGGTGFYLRALTHGLFGGPPPDPELRAALDARFEAEGGAALHAELATVDPEAAARLHPADRKRVVRALEVHAQTGRPLSAWQREWRDADEAERPGRPRRVVGLELPPEVLGVRVLARARAMLAAGWADEVRRLNTAGGLGETAAQALGYTEVGAWVDRGAPEAERDAVAEAIAARTRRFARRQRTWWRRYPETRWLDARRPPDELADAALAHLAQTP